MIQNSPFLHLVFFSISTRKSPLFNKMVLQPENAKSIGNTMVSDKMYFKLYTKQSLKILKISLNIFLRLKHWLVLKQKSNSIEKVWKPGTHLSLLIFFLHFSSPWFQNLLYVLVHEKFQHLLLQIPRFKGTFNILIVVYIHWLSATVWSHRESIYHEPIFTRIRLGS